jgi:hypothetical protein
VGYVEARKRSLRGRPDSVAEPISNYLNQWKKIV